MGCEVYKQDPLPVLSLPSGPWKCEQAAPRSCCHSLTPLQPSCLPCCVGLKPWAPKSPRSLKLLLFMYLVIAMWTSKSHRTLLFGGDRVSNGGQWKRLRYSCDGYTLRVYLIEYLQVAKLINIILCTLNHKRMVVQKRMCRIRGDP